MTEEGAREAMTAGGARLQARKQIAASRDGLDAGLISSAQAAFWMARKHASAHFIGTERG